MLEYEFEASTVHSMFMAAHAYERAMNAQLAPDGITHRQCQVLAWLAMEKSLSQSELAERLNIEPPTLVGVLDRMERDELIARSNCPVDRRRKIIKPLPKAEAVWQQIVAGAEKVESRALHGISEEQLAACKQVLDSIQANLQREAAINKA